MGARAKGLAVSSSSCQSGTTRTSLVRGRYPASPCAGSNRGPKGRFPASPCTGETAGPRRMASVTLMRRSSTASRRKGRTTASPCTGSCGRAEARSPKAGQKGKCSLHRMSRAGGEAAPAGPSLPRRSSNNWRTQGRYPASPCTGRWVAAAAQGRSRRCKNGRSQGKCCNGKHF